MIDTLGIADELIARLSSARNEPSSIFTKKILRKLADECIGKINQGVDITKHVIVASNAFSELAQVENNIRKRREFRRKAILICKEQFNNNKYFHFLIISYCLIRAKNRTKNNCFGLFSYR